MPDPIYIIGAGAIGKALAVFLQLEGRNVKLLRGSVDEQLQSVENIAIELPDGSTLSADINLYSLSNFEVLDGLVILTNKTYGNERLSRILSSKIKDAPVLLLQNGLNIEEPFINAGFPRILRCVLFVSCQLVTANLIRYKPAHVSPVGLIKGEGEDLSKIIQQLKNPYFLFEASDAIQTSIWTKAMINAVFNSLCPLLETDNGIFQRNEKALAIAEVILMECMNVAKLNGVYLEFEKVKERLLLISKSSDGQLISTYVDILNKRPTEIDSLNFAFVRFANALDKPELVKNTKILGELIKVKAGI